MRHRRKQAFPPFAGRVVAAADPPFACSGLPLRCRQTPVTNLRRCSRPLRQPPWLRGDSVDPSSELRFGSPARTAGRIASSRVRPGLARHGLRAETATAPACRGRGWPCLVSRDPDADRETGRVPASLSALRLAYRPHPPIDLFRRDVFDVRSHTVHTWPNGSSSVAERSP